MSVTVTPQITQQTVTVTGNPVENNVTVTVSNARGPAGADGGGGGASEWGAITGTLADQTDLQAALDAKQPLSAVLTATTASFLTADEAKLDGIATGATANSSDATLLARANHTGTQAHTTITGLGTLATQSATITDYLTIASASATYQPLDGDLTSWAGVTRASGFDTFAATPSSANLAALVTGETGSGALVFGTSPTLTTPVLGVASATSFAMAAGSLSAPFLTFGDADSGFYAPDSKTIAFCADGAQKFRFDSAGMTIVSAGGAATRTFTVFDGSTTFSAGLNSSSVQAFGFSDITTTAVGRFERNTSNGLIRFVMQNFSGASLSWDIGNAAASVRTRAAASQTANIEEWRDSSESVLAAIAKNGAFKPASMADASAENGTLYYSTTASKLVFKDAGGTVNNLY